MSKQYESDQFIKTGGTNSQFLKADGTVDSNTYLTSADHKWDDATGGISYAGGKVGIGTTAPSTALHIKGASAGTGYVTIENTVHVAKLALKSSTYTGNLVMDGIGGYISGGGFILDSGTNPRTQFLQGGVSKMIINNGNVGIGTTSPSTPLHIKADAPTLRLEDNTSSDNHYLTANNGEFRVQSTGYITIRPNNATSTTFLANGNVGINDTNAQKKLTVNGQTQFYEYGGAHLTNLATSNFNFDTLANNSASTSGGSVGAYIKVTATPPGNTGTWSAFRARAYGENTQGNTDEMVNFFAEYRNYTSTNAVTLSHHAGLKVNPLGVGGLATVTNNYGIHINPGTSATNNYGIYQSGTGVKNFFQGNVGIGTSSPSEKLVISDGNLHINTPASSNSGNGIRLNRPGANYAGFEIATNDTIDWSIGANSTGFGIYENGLSATTRLIIKDGGNVGIGTTTPDFKLDVNGDIRIEEKHFLMFGGVSATDPNWLIQNNQSADFTITEGSSGVRFVIENGGNVGIGTTSPSAKLHILDNAEQSQVHIGSDASNYLKVDVSGDGDSTISAVGSGFLPPNIRFNTNSTTILAIDGTVGYVGIGTVSPSEKLEVDGNVQADTLIATDLSDGYVPYNRNGTLGLQDSEIYQDNGKVGIGTTTLSQTLNVDGDVLADGYRLSAMQTAPASKSAAGTLGEVRITSNAIYVCYATNSWSKATLATSW